MLANDVRFVELMLRNAEVRCPRCGRLMPATLALCIDCMWDECIAADHQEAIDEAQWMAEMEARETDWREWQQERWEMSQCGGF